MNIILGALWRRWLGSNIGPRWLKLLCALILTWPIWLALAWWLAALASFFCILFFIPGHKVDSWTVWLRYGPFAAGYVVAKKLFPEPWRINNFVDGWMSLGELFLGASFWFSVEVVCYMLILA